uniref:Uncharacterized protein n=1 Tax=Siphoviridae sp. ctj0M16 TaxID=2827918 RepID=A0A8S5S6X5_9CAUD|nr:MAG TPA: hypothetical protein [Siphoviridae sp. ctj0M16]
MLILYSSVNIHYNIIKCSIFCCHFASSQPLHKSIFSTIKMPHSAIC